ncbi:hypothetical protein IG631_15909 [Alternaria alternata]|nr:hypothetical protein IG631_15909 [Alternaria alternata]
MRPRSKGLLTTSLSDAWAPTITIRHVPMSDTIQLLLTVALLLNDGLMLDAQSLFQSCSVHNVGEWCYSGGLGAGGSV